MRESIERRLALAHSSVKAINVSERMDVTASRGISIQIVMRYQKMITTLSKDLG